MHQFIDSLEGAYNKQMHQFIDSLEGAYFILFFYIYHPYRKVMNQNVLQGSAPYKIEQRPFTVKLN